MSLSVRRDGLRGVLMRHEPLSQHTSWRVGGPADQYFRPADLDDLVTFVAQLPHDKPVLLMGLGSNLLVRDGGWRGVVIATHRALGGLERAGGRRVLAGAGITCALIAKRCARWGLAKAHFFAGIPGTLGGALAMNAGAFGGETWDHVVKVQTLDRAGRLRWRKADEYQVGYREVVQPRGEWYVGALLEFDEDPTVSEDQIRDLLARRKASQPIGLPSCGSVFRNPTGDHAARLIEAAGLKGHRIGGAEVSKKHANFIINIGGASAADVEQLIEHVRARVESEFGVDLIPEVKIVGEPV